MRRKDRPQHRGKVCAPDCIWSHSMDWELSVERLFKTSIRTLLVCCVVCVVSWSCGGSRPMDLVRQIFVLIIHYVAAGCASFQNQNHKTYSTSEGSISPLASIINTSSSVILHYKRCRDRLPRHPRRPRSALKIRRRTSRSNPQEEHHHAAGFAPSVRLLDQGLCAWHLRRMSKNK